MTKDKKSHKMVSTTWLTTQTGNAFFHLVPDQQISFDLDDGVIKNYALFGNVLQKLK